MNHEPKSKLKYRLINGLVIIARLALGCIFIASGIAKMRQPYDFLGGVYSYELVGPRLGLAVAMALPWLELFVGICLVGGIFVTGALLACLAMCATFSIALIWALLQGLEINCACFNPADTTVINYWTALRAILLLLAAIACYLYTVLKLPQQARAATR